MPPAPLPVNSVQKLENLVEASSRLYKAFRGATKGVTRGNPAECLQHAITAHSMAI